MYLSLSMDKATPKGGDSEGAPPRPLGADRMPMDVYIYIDVSIFIYG